MIDFDVTEKEARIISKLATRATKLLDGKKLDWRMDFTACHKNGNELRLEDLLKADDFNFMHDAIGINEHLDRETGQLTDFFLPRFSKRETITTSSTN